MSHGRRKYHLQRPTQVLPCSLSSLSARSLPLFSPQAAAPDPRPSRRAAHPPPSTRAPASSTWSASAPPAAPTLTPRAPGHRRRHAGARRVPGFPPRTAGSRIWAARLLLAAAAPLRTGGSLPRSRLAAQAAPAADPPRPAPCLAPPAALRRGPVWKRRRLPAVGSPRRADRACQGPTTTSVRHLRRLPGRRLFAFRIGWNAKWVLCLGVLLDRVSCYPKHCVRLILSLDSLTMAKIR